MKRKKALLLIVLASVFLLAGCTDAARSRIQHWEDKYFSQATVTMPAFVTPSGMKDRAYELLPTATPALTVTPSPETDK